MTIKQVEVSIIDRAWESGWVTPSAPDWLSGKRVAVIGSGPGGLAAAQQLARAGHTVTVYERAERAGGLLRYGIPEFKMEKSHLDRRLDQMEAEGVIFRNSVEAGVDISARQLRKRHDVVVLTVGATAARDLPVPGRELAGIHQAMEYLPLSNKVCEGTLAETPIHAAGKHVVIIGGGDTGADCLGTAHRQGAASVTQLEILPLPPDLRPESAPVADLPDDLPGLLGPRGGRRPGLLGEHQGVPRRRARATVRALRLVEVELVDGRFTEVEGSSRELPADLVFLAMGFTGPERGPLLDAARRRPRRPRQHRARPPLRDRRSKGVFVAGDAGRGQSLIVWAIAEGRAAAAGVDAYLMGSTNLPAPIPPARRCWSDTAPVA